MREGLVGARAIFYFPLVRDYARTLSPRLRDFTREIAVAYEPRKQQQRFSLHAYSFERIIIPPLLLSAPHALRKSLFVAKRSDGGGYETRSFQFALLARRRSPQNASVAFANLLTNWTVIFNSLLPSPPPPPPLSPEEGSPFEKRSRIECRRALRASPSRGKRTTHIGRVGGK